jgi:hypothetical protein
MRPIYFEHYQIPVSTRAMVAGQLAWRVIRLGIKKILTAHSYFQHRINLWKIYETFF